MSNTYSNRRREQKISVDADQAEYSAVLYGTAVVDAGIYDDRVANALQDDPEADAETPTWQRWQLDDVLNDQRVGGVHEEVERRLALMGDAYPFTLSGSNLAYNASSTGLYEFCLATSCARSLTEGEYVHLPRTFERLCAQIVKEYLGHNSHAVHVGWPRDETVGTRFEAAMRHLHLQSREWIWAPQPDLSEDPAEVRDEGVDFVVWKRAVDGRIGQLFILGQCACGNDWDTKFDDLNLGKLRKWFHPVTYVEPVRAFATPHVLSEGHLINAHRDAGLVFDRVRMALIAERAVAPDDILGWQPRLGELASLVIRPQGTGLVAPPPQ